MGRLLKRGSEPLQTSSGCGDEWFGSFNRSRKKNERVRSTSLLLVFVWLCSGCAQPAPAARKPPPAVSVITVRAKTIPIFADFVGTTGAVQDVDIRARVKGTLEQVNFKEGSLVKAGQVLFVLQKDAYQAAVQAAQASLLKAKAQLYQAQQSVPVLQAQAVVEQKVATVGREQLSVNRLTPLAGARGAAKRSRQRDPESGRGASRPRRRTCQSHLDSRRAKGRHRDGAKPQFLSSQATLANAKLNLSYCTIAAPATGVIGFLKYDVGNVVGDADSQVLDTISTVDPIKVHFAADENTYLSLAQRTHTYHGARLRDQPVALLALEQSAFTYKGSLYTVNRALDTKTGTIAVEARFPNPDGLLRPGQFARVRVVTESRRTRS